MKSSEYPEGDERLEELRRVTWRRQDRFANARIPLDEMIHELLPPYRERAAELLNAIEETVLRAGNESIGDRASKLLFLGFLGLVLGVVPIGITASLFAYSAGLSALVGKWMFFSGVAFGDLAFVIGFLVGQDSPKRRLI